MYLLTSPLLHFGPQCAAKFTTIIISTSCTARPRQPLNENPTLIKYEVP